MWDILEDYAYDSDAKEEEGDVWAENYTQLKEEDYFVKVKDEYDEHEDEEEEEAYDGPICKTWTDYAKVVAVGVFLLCLR